MSNEKLEPKQIVYIHLIALIVNVVWLFTFTFLTEYLQSIICFVIGVLFTIWPCYLIPNLLIQYKSKQEFKIKTNINNINNILIEKNYSQKEYFENGEITVFEKQNKQSFKIKNYNIRKRVIIYKPNTSSKEEIYSTINSIKELFDKELKFYKEKKKAYYRAENILLIVFKNQKDTDDVVNVISKHIYVSIWKNIFRNFFIPIVLTEDEIVFGKIASNFLLSSKTIAYEAKKDYIINDNSKLYYF